MNNQDKKPRFQTDDLMKKGFRAYPVSPSVKNRDLFSKVLYHRYFLENFYIGDVVFVKERKNEEQSTI